MMKILNLIWNVLIGIQKFILFICSFLIIIGVASKAIFRYLFQIDFHGVEEFIILLAFWLYFIGASYGSYRKGHIAADIIPMYIKDEKIKQIFMLFVSLLTIGISALFTLWAVDMLTWTLERGATSVMWDIPVAYSQAVILISFVLMTFYFVVHFINDLKMFLNNHVLGERKEVHTYEQGDKA